MPDNALVLDVGCGSAAWARAFAKQHPASKVLAIDITPLAHLDLLPNNCEFRQVDVEQQWPFDKFCFDYIHVRMLTYAIRDWETFLLRCSCCLKPGGWIELNDTTAPYRAHNPAANVLNSKFLNWSCLFEMNREQAGFDARASLRHQDRLRLLGFINTKYTPLRWPAHPSWPTDERDKQIGALTFKNFKTLLEVAGHRLLCAAYQMKTEEAKRAVADVIEDLEKNAIVNKYYLPL